MSEEKTMRLSQVARKLNVGRTTILDFLSEKGFEVDSNPNSKVTSEQFAMLSKEFAASASEKEEASGLTIGTKHTEHVGIEREQEETTRKTAEEEDSILIKNLATDKADVVEEPKEEESPKPEKLEQEKPKLKGITVLGKIDLDKKKEEESAAKEEEPEPVEEKPVVEDTPVVEEPAPEPVQEEKPEPKEEVVEEPEVKPEPETQKEVEEQKVIEAKAEKLKGLKVVGKIELPVEKEKKTKPVASSDDKNV